MHQGQLVRLVTLRCNQTILARGRQSDELFSLYPVHRLNADGIWHGRRLAPGHLVVHGQDGFTNHRSAKAMETTGFSVSASYLEEAARHLLGCEEVSLPRTWTTFTPSPEVFHAIHQHFQRLSATGTEILTCTAEGKQVEQDCVRIIISGVIGRTVRLRQPLALHVRAKLVRRADEAMRSHLCMPLGIVDLCAMLGVSDRNLRLAFREHFGIGPMTYYRFIRLNQVRTALKTDTDLTVAGIARSYGFHHLGNFAVDYRRLFGERPSDTYFSTKLS